MSGRTAGSCSRTPSSCASPRTGTSASARAGHIGRRPRARSSGRFGYVRESFFYGRPFLNDADLNAQALSWLERTANARTHRTTAEVPRVRFERDERVLLKPLALTPYRSWSAGSHSPAGNRRIRR